MKYTPRVASFSPEAVQYLEMVNKELRSLQYKKYSETLNSVLEKKAALINDYFRFFGLKSALVAVSGGIDSSLALNLIKYASLKKDSPIEKILAVSLPVLDGKSAVNQDKAAQRAKELCSLLCVEYFELDVTPAFEAVVEQTLKVTGMQDRGWSTGQLASYQRTPMLYYLTALMTQRGFPCLLVGTTNYSEGAYLGYFGKASDGMTDLQIMSDLFKSEVYELSAMLTTPKSILEIIPTGDMYDSRVDEEVFGAPYAAVELLLHSKIFKKDVFSLIDARFVKEVKLWIENIEQLHNYNKHKYLGKSPAIHLDVLDRRFEGSWDYSTWGGCRE